MRLQPSALWTLSPGQPDDARDSSRTSVSTRVYDITSRKAKILIFTVDKTWITVRALKYSSMETTVPQADIKFRHAVIKSMDLLQLLHWEQSFRTYRAYSQCQIQMIKSWNRLKHSNFIFCCSILMQCMQPDQICCSLKDPPQFATLQFCWTLPLYIYLIPLFQLHMLSVSQSMMTVNGGLQRIWIETVTSFFKLQPQHWPNRAEKSVKTSVRIANFYLDQEFGTAQIETGRTNHCTTMLVTAIWIGCTWSKQCLGPSSAVIARQLLHQHTSVFSHCSQTQSPVTTKFYPMQSLHTDITGVYLHLINKQQLILKCFKQMLEVSMNCLFYVMF